MGEVVEFPPQSVTQFVISPVIADRLLYYLSSSSLTGEEAPEFMAYVMLLQQIKNGVVPEELKEPEGPEVT